MRTVPLQRAVPVVILSSSSAPNDIARAERLGVSRYIRKPSTLDEYLEIGRTVKEFWAAPEP
jgi:CheY-like chemotaxis protein